MAHEGNSVLILEDQLLLSMDLEMKLEALGLTVFGSFKCVESALQALDQGTPQAALLDINLGHDRTSEPIDLPRLRSILLALLPSHDTLHHPIAS
jgi:DNA-binding NarL/FixJ family response regulator